MPPTTFHRGPASIHLFSKNRLPILARSKTRGKLLARFPLLAPRVLFDCPPLVAAHFYPNGQADLCQKLLAFIA